MEKPRRTSHELRGYQIREARVVLRSCPDGVTPQELSVETGRPLDVSEAVFRYMEEEAVFRYMEEDGDVTKRGDQWFPTSN